MRSLGASTDRGTPHEPFTALPNHSHPFCAARRAGSPGAVRECRYPGHKLTQLRDDARGLLAASGGRPVSWFLATSLFVFPRPSASSSSHKPYTKSCSGEPHLIACVLSG